VTLVAPTRVTEQAAFVLAPNPGPMTLDGTNSYLLAAPGAGSSIVVDPGPDHADHLSALAAGPVELILITHRHHDHTEGAAALARLTGAPVRAADPSFCIDGEPLRDGEIITAAGLPVTVISTPGHTIDSVSFLLAADGPAGSVLTGDTILGRGTTVIAPPDGSLGAYLDSLRLLAGLGPRFVLPAHGPQRPDLSSVAAEYLAHREQRLAAIRDVLDRLGPDASVGSVTDAVYTDIDPSVRFAAEHSVAAQLDYLRATGPNAP
jgi:glyoxylase-like metal-dependent hydrolase (beta-lactamase superfamily II)